MEPVMIPISWGELIDKITILTIKERRLSAPDQLANVRHELKMLVAVRDRHASLAENWQAIADALQDVNEQLWDMEDEIREYERLKDFGPRFIDVARRIYRTNDRRAALKRQLSQAFGSGVLEEKSYASYA